MHMHMRACTVWLRGLVRSRAGVTNLEPLAKVTAVPVHQRKMNFAIWPRNGLVWSGDHHRAPHTIERHIMFFISPAPHCVGLVWPAGAVGSVWIADGAMRGRGPVRAQRAHVITWSQRSYLSTSVSIHLAHAIAVLTAIGCIVPRRLKRMVHLPAPVILVAPVVVVPRRRPVIVPRGRPVIVPGGRRPWFGFGVGVGVGVG
jgi:hypothetical protein